MKSKSKPKLKILMCSEASFINSGFGKYANEILSRLHNTNKYIVAEFASYGLVNDPRDKNIDWIYYANAVRDTDGRYKEYMSRTDNQFGRWRFEKVLLDFKPDVVIDVRDYWMSNYQAYSPLRPYFHHILMPTVDSAPQQEEWLDTFLSADAIFTYSDWGANTIKEQTNNKINYIDTTSPGVNLDVFKIEDSRQNKIDFGIDPDSFIIGSVMRNQKRKLIPELFFSLQKLLSILEKEQCTKNVYLYLHTTYPDMGWNIPELLAKYKISNRVLFTYYCKNCSAIEACVFSGPLKICKKCLKKSSALPAVSNGVSDHQLSTIYNLFDLYVQYAICEGFGMPQVEAGACGIPIATVEYSAMVDVIKKLNAYAIPVKSYYTELETKAVRVYPDNDKLISIIIDQLNKPYPMRQQERFQIRSLAEKHYDWNSISKIWEKYLDSIEFRANWSNALKPLIKPIYDSKNNSSNFEQLMNLCNNYLHNTDLASSYRILNLLQNADYGFSYSSPTQINQANIKDMYDYVGAVIENNNKSADVIRSQQVFTEDFIQYAHLKNTT